MTGSVSVKIRDSHNSYSFELKRNITILCGESGRGKTTLFDMVEDYNRYGKSSATKISCPRDIVAVRGTDWNSQIEKISDSVIVIDEDSDFIRSQKFAETVRNSSNYFLLITRCYLPQLPVSVTEIYELTGNKNKKFKRVYTDSNYMYDAPAKNSLPFRPEIIITEDSRSGYQFYDTLTKDTSIECVSAGGKSNIYKILSRYRDENVLVIADGAAFGAEIREIVEAQRLFPRKIGIFLPESFEWLILKSGLVNDPEWEKLTLPEEYVDSRQFFSWEQYFTALLTDITKDDSYRRYPKNKSNLPQFYMQDSSLLKVKKIMNGIKFS